MLYATTQNSKFKTKINNLVSSKRYLAQLYQTLPKPKERRNWQKSIKNTEKKISKLTNEITSQADSLKKEQGLRDITYKDITFRLKKNELYIDYAKIENNYYLFSLDHQENITFIQIDKKSTKKIESLIKTFREDITTILNKKLSDKELTALTKHSKKKLSTLYELVIRKPLDNIIKDKTSLIISPDGALRLLPFETLYDKEKGKYFIEEKEIRYIPSGKELVRLYKYSKNNVNRKQSTVIFSNPNFNTKIASSDKEEIAITPNTSRSGIIKSLFRMRFSSLPGTEEEANAIQSILKNTKVKEYAKGKATESNLLKIKEPTVLHIATHGFFINDNSIPNPMLKSGIALAGANTSVIRGKSDGVVTALKLSGLDLKGTNLVVLSACETGVVDINATDSVSGLSKAFIQAGAKDIVMSLWSVDDQATKELMSSFYREMKATKNYAEALKAAKLKMIEEGRHPFYWGAFVVCGL
jgi:CHAT domain-containing protein